MATAQAISPFLWKGNQAVTKAELDRQKAISDALRPAKGYSPTGPWSTIGALADEGVADFKDGQTSQAETAAQQAVADALAKGDYQSVVGSDMATPQQSAVAQALWQQQNQENDPLRKLEIEQAQLNLDQDKNPPVEPPKAPTITDQYDPATGRSRKMQWDAGTGTWQPFGGIEAPKEPLVTVNNGDNSGTFQKKGDELAATRMDGILTEGENVPQTIGDLKTLASLGAQIDTGKGAQLTEALGPYAEALGVDIKGLPEMQAYKAITDRMAPQMRKPGSGASSDTDVRMFLSALPSLGRTPEGNQIIVQTLTAIQQSKQAAAAIAQKAFLPKEQGGITWQEAEKQIQSLPDPYEGFSSYRKQADAANNATKITTTEEFDALPSGSLYIDPGDGNTYRKP